jgi:hypothetical protein
MRIADHQWKGAVFKLEDLMTRNFTQPLTYLNDTCFRKKIGFWDVI